MTVSEWMYHRALRWALILWCRPLVPFCCWLSEWGYQGMNRVKGI